ncbi:uncharacterized protein LOC129794020 isoform X1 [Lutzomyia longipalpis]|uniref:uncharacterized protein LOC129794020 isoform X1 n=1 Tax=Lutzomyia longipalpis TaxID=7200 RepID=UPI002483D348|nr:uncharacterized protein LOC129794020 isoform X1 [Lutzomyia longipalpis]
MAVYGIFLLITLFSASGMVRASGVGGEVALEDVWGGDESVEDPWPPGNFLQEHEIRDTGEKRSALRATMARRSQKSKEEQFIPSISVGALTNLRGFFDNLKYNLESLESKALTPNQVRFLTSSNTPPENFKYEYVEENQIKPTGTAAFLHAIRHHRPSNRIRTLVPMNAEPYRNPALYYAGRK